jgi:acetyl esterase/lipase
MDDVRVQRELEYGADAALPLTFDLYTPKAADAAGRLPVVLLVAGYPDPGMERILGCRTKEMGWSSSWGRLIAASGMAAVAYANREPERDIKSVLRHLRENGARLGIDAERIALLAASGHGPLAMATLIDDRAASPLRGAALVCPLLLDLDGSTAVADAAKTFRFANPAAGRTVDDLRPRTALFIARAGLDETPGLNQTLDRFVAHALARNLPLTVVNLPEAPHAFDLMHDRDCSREAVRAALRFLRFALEAEAV